MQSQQFQNVQDVIYSLRKAAVQQRQKKFIIYLRMFFIYTDGLGNLYRDFVRQQVPIPIQILKKKINIASYILNYLSEAHGIAFNNNLELSFVIEGKSMTITQSQKESSAIVKHWLGKKIQPIVALLIKDLVYVNRICQAVVIDCDAKARIKQRLRTNRSGNYQVMLHEVTLRLNKYVTAKALSDTVIPVGTGLNVIITGIFDSGRIEATYVYSTEEQELELDMFYPISIDKAIQMSLDKNYKEVPVGKIIPAKVVHFKKIVNFDWSMNPKIEPPIEFYSMARMNRIKLNGDDDLQASFVYPPYYEYTLELLDSKIVLKGSCIGNPVLDQISSAVEQAVYRITMVNVKVKSISYITDYRTYFIKQKVNIEFKIESLKLD
jgi:hypothetical protein